MHGACERLGEHRHVVGEVLDGEDLVAGLTIDSANPPASFTPKDRKFSQNNGWSRTKCGQCPHADALSTATRWPGSRWWTPAPTSRTTPTDSCPGVSGNSEKNPPEWMWRSVPQTPDSATSMTTSPAAARGAGTSLTLKSRGPA